MTALLSVFYRPEQSCDPVGYSPSAGKPAQVVADWLSQPDIAPHIQIETFTAASNEVLFGAHDPDYVRGVMSCEIENGFGDNSHAIAESLRYTVGSMVAACKYVLTHGVGIACSPTSGFHHAGYDFGGGYCTFNGLMAAAIRVHELGLAKKILILDFDQHYGNGTQDIIDRLGIDYVTHITAGRSYKDRSEAWRYCYLLTLRRFLKGKNFDLIIFQAGADIHVDDPLGGIFTTEDMRERDFGIFMGGWIYNQIPIVFNLAGGYQIDKLGTIAPVIALHRQTVQEAIRRLG